MGESRRWLGCWKRGRKRKTKARRGGGGGSDRLDRDDRPRVVVLLLLLLLLVAVVASPDRTGAGEHERPHEGPGAPGVRSRRSSYEWERVRQFDLGSQPADFALDRVVFGEESLEFANLADVTSEWRTAAHSAAATAAAATATATAGGQRSARAIDRSQPADFALDRVVFGEESLEFANLADVTLQGRLRLSRSGYPAWVFESSEWRTAAHSAAATAAAATATATAARPSTSS
jgi:hypothetical protein